MWDLIVSVPDHCLSFYFEAFVIKNNLIYELQSGFRGNFSTDTCLIHLTDHKKKNSSKGLYTGMIYRKLLTRLTTKFYVRN